MAGFSAGLAIALVSLMGSGGATLPDDAVARVNSSFISRASYERALSAVDSDKRAALTDSDRQQILQRLIDEELLIQYGLRQGLVRSDNRVKASLVQAVIATKMLQAESREIPLEEALEFFETNRKLFSQTQRLRVGLIRIPTSSDRDLSDSKARADEAVNKLSAGLSFSEVQAAYHEGGALNLPDALLPMGKLADYIGPMLTSRAAALQPGHAAVPELINNSWQVVYLHERLEAAPPHYGDVKELVLTEIKRRDTENLLRKSLGKLRETQEIVISEMLL